MAKRKKKQEYPRIRRDSGQYRRIIAAGAVLGALVFIPVGLRLYSLMVTQYEYYADLALKNQSRTTRVPGERGIIYDRNMNVLAGNTGVETVYLDPHELKQSKENLEEISRELGKILMLEPSWIVQQGKDLTKRYKQIAADVNEDKAGQIRAYINANEISGIHLEPGSKRRYPYGSLASQVIGFTNASGTGSEGVEAAYNSYLSAKTGAVITTKGSNELDMPFSYENYISSQSGCNVVLTLDVTVQQCLEKRMMEAIDRYDVQNGAFGMVMDVNTGEILAMATLGGYDPNNYLEIYDPQQAGELEQQRLSYLLNPVGSTAYTQGLSKYREVLRAAQLKQWRNRCISDGYEPGSTFKVMTMAAALDCGAIDLETGFYCRGSEQIPGRSQLLHCWRSTGHGSEKTPQALQNSCNIAFAHIALKLGGERFYTYVKDFGVLEKTGIDLAGESKGVFFDKALVTDTDKWGTASLTSASFGQTFKLTPLQLVRAIASVVNGGELLEPYIVSEVMDAQGNTVLKQEPTVIRRTIKEETSRIMCRLLESVVTEGTAKNATVLGFSVGGKTGTSEKIDVFDENGQRVLDKIVSFVGIAPMDDPQYIVLVALDTPSRTTGMYISGGVMAAPTVGAVLQDILPYLEVHRSYAPDEVAGKSVEVEDFTGKTKQEAQIRLKTLGIEALYLGQEQAVTGQIPEPGGTLPADGQMILYFGDDQEKIAVVPDMIGMTQQQAADAAGKEGIYLRIVGNRDVLPSVKAVAQSVPAGSRVDRGTTVEVRFADTDTRN